MWGGCLSRPELVVQLPEFPNHRSVVYHSVDMLNSEVSALLLYYFQQRVSKLQWAKQSWYFSSLAGGSGQQPYELHDRRDECLDRRGG